MPLPSAPDRLPVPRLRRRSTLADDGDAAGGSVAGVLSRVVWAGHDLSLAYKTKRRVPRPPREAIVALDAAPDVVLVLSQSPWYFSPPMYAQESAFAHELAARGRAFAVTERADRIVDKSVAWFPPDFFVSPRLWDYSRQAREFAAGLERQGNQAFCSSDEMALWENKARMHERLDEVGAPTPKTRILAADTWESVPFDIEPVLIKKEHSSGSAGIRHFATARAAREYAASYRFQPTESLIMQELVRGATRDLRVTMVGERVIESASYWRVKSDEALASGEWTSTATTYNSRVEHGDIPPSVVPFVAGHLRQLGVRTAGVDLMWPDDDLTQPPLILELSPQYQPNPPKPARYAELSYKQFKADWAAEDGYLARQYQVFREIAAEILDQDLF